VVLLLTELTDGKKRDLIEQARPGWNGNAWSIPIKED